MRIRQSQDYIDAPYELALVDHKGRPVQDVPFGLPYRFARPLTNEEWEDGLKNGFEKYCVPPLEIINEDPKTPNDAGQRSNDRSGLGG